MRLQIPVRGIHGLPDAAQIRLAIRQARNASGCLREDRERGQQQSRSRYASDSPVSESHVLAILAYSSKAINRAGDRWSKYINRISQMRESRIMPARVSTTPLSQSAAARYTVAWPPNMQSSKLERAEAILRDLAHDLRQPLSHIEVTAYLLNSSPAIDPQIREQIQTVGRQAELASGILSEALAAMRRLRDQEDAVENRELTNSATAVVR